MAAKVAAETETVAAEEAVVGAMVMAVVLAVAMAVGMALLDMARPSLVQQSFLVGQKESLG